MSSGPCVAPKPAWARRRPRLPRSDIRWLSLPGRRQLCIAAVLLGVLSAASVVLLPVEAAFGDDPILRLRSFDSTSAGPATEVDCGSVVSGFRGSGDTVTLYGIARDRACRDAASRRVVTAVAAAAVVVLLGSYGLISSSPRLARASSSPRLAWRAR